MKTGIVYDPIYLEHRTGMHVESPERLIGIMDFLEEKKVLENPDFILIDPRKATTEQIKYVHTESLINEVKEASALAEATHRLQYLDEGDTIASGRTFEASLYSVGGNLMGLDNIIENKVENVFAAVRPPGHHSNSYKCSGFCIFNNIAIATEYLFREKNIKKVAIIDWDCHHGNGTQDIFYNGSESGEVVIFNSHQDGRTLYPGSGFINEIGSGKGEGKIINFPLPPRAAEDTVLIFFEEVVKPVCREFQPEFILISAGFDTHWTDELTNMGWTYQGPAKYLKKLKTVADEFASGRILITLEGGYEIDKQAKAVYNCLQILNNSNQLIEEKSRESDKVILNYINDKVIPNLKDSLKPYWNCF